MFMIYRPPGKTLRQAILFYSKIIKGSINFVFVVPPVYTQGGIPKLVP